MQPCSQQSSILDIKSRKCPYAHTLQTGNPPHQNQWCISHLFFWGDLLVLIAAPGTLSKGHSIWHDFYLYRLKTTSTKNAAGRVRTGARENVLRQGMFIARVGRVCIHARLPCGVFWLYRWRYRRFLYPSQQVDGPGGASNFTYKCTTSWMWLCLPIQNWTVGY